MTDREEFEQSFPPPAHVEWDGEEYSADDTVYEEGTQHEYETAVYKAHDHNLRWETWQTARTGREEEPRNSDGVPPWDWHDWAQVFFFEHAWYGTREGWSLKNHISNEFKGRQPNLLREDGGFICYGTYNGNWEDSLTVRPAPAEKAEPIDDESARRRIGELGNMLHNFSCEYQNNDYICSRLSTLAGEAWDISKAASPVAPAAKVPEVWRETIALAASHLGDWLDAHECECEMGHICGRPNVEQTRQRLLDMLSAAPQPVGDGEALKKAREVVPMLVSAVCGVIQDSTKKPINLNRDRFAQLKSAAHEYEKRHDLIMGVAQPPEGER